MLIYIYILITIGCYICLPSFIRCHHFSDNLPFLKTAGESLQMNSSAGHPGWCLICFPHDDHNMRSISSKEGVSTVD